MILAPPPSPLADISSRDTLLMGGGGAQWWEQPKSWILYTSFNILWISDIFSLVFHHMWETVNWLYDFLSSSPPPLFAVSFTETLFRGGGSNSTWQQQKKDFVLLYKSQG
jgi:hypothetical protein